MIIDGIHKQISSTFSRVQDIAFNFPFHELATFQNFTPDNSARIVKICLHVLFYQIKIKIFISVIFANKIRAFYYGKLQVEA